ncbi:hypothetical protein HDU80_009984, partial [Chytriomyces hyalinus]
MAKDILDMQSYVEALGEKIGALEAKNQALETTLTLLQHDARSNNEAKLTAIEAKVTAIEAKLGDSKAKLTKNEAKVTAIEAKVTAIEAKMADSKAKLTKNEAKLTAIEAKMADSEAKLTAIEAKMADSESMLTAIISTLAPGNLVAIHTSGRSDGKTVLFKNLSNYTVVVKSERTDSKFVKRRGEAEIDLGSRSDSLVIISIPELGLYHIYKGNARQLQWKGFPNRLIVAPDATSLIPPISCFTEGEEVEFITNTNASYITVKNKSEHSLPIQVWNGSGFANVAHQATLTLPTTRFATIVVRDPQTHVT